MSYKMINKMITITTDNAARARAALSAFNAHVQMAASDALLYEQVRIMSERLARAVAIVDPFYGPESEEPLKMEQSVEPFDGVLDGLLDGDWTGYNEAFENMLRLEQEAIASIPEEERIFYSVRVSMYADDAVIVCKLCDNEGQYDHHMLCPMRDPLWKSNMIAKLRGTGGNNDGSEEKLRAIDVEGDKN